MEGFLIWVGRGLRRVFEKPQVARLGVVMFVGAFLQRVSWKLDGQIISTVFEEAPSVPCVDRRDRYP